MDQVLGMAACVGVSLEEAWVYPGAEWLGRDVRRYRTERQGGHCANALEGHVRRHNTPAMTETHAVVHCRDMS